MSQGPTTQAVRQLRANGIDYSSHLYRYSDRSGAKGAAEELGLDPHQVVKTLIMETDQGSPLCVLMHGDEMVSVKTLARIIGARSIQPATERQAHKWSGYQVGGTSPFGLRSTMPIYIESSILEYDQIFINGGKRGFLVGLATQDLVNELDPIAVEAKA